MVYKKQPMLTSLFVDMNGHAWPEEWVTSYNRYTRDINKSAGIDVSSESLTQKERDFYLDQRHRHFVQRCELLCEQNII